MACNRANVKVSRCFLRIVKRNKDWRALSRNMTNNMTNKEEVELYSHNLTSESKYDDNFLWNGWPAKACSLFIQPVRLSTFLAVVNPAHHELNLRRAEVKKTRVQSCKRKINMVNFAENNREQKQYRRANFRHILTNIQQISVLFSLKVLLSFTVFFEQVRVITSTKKW